MPCDKSRKFASLSADGKSYSTKHYKLAATIAVGHKVNSERAVQFRKWANTIIESFTIKGYAMDDERLKNSATLVNVPEVPNAAKYGESELTVLLYELKADMAAYLADIIAYNEKNAAKELKFFAQEHFISAQAKGGLDSQEYRDALANNHRYARAQGIDQVMAEHQLDALVAPTSCPACSAEPRLLPSRSTRNHTERH